MLRSVVRDQILERGILSFLFLFLVRLVLLQCKGNLKHEFKTEPMILTSVSLINVKFWRREFCFFVSFLVFYHIFILADNRSLMSWYTDTHIIYHRIDCMLLLKKQNRSNALVYKKIGTS